MTHNTEGIVLRRIVHTSQKEIVTIYTRSGGLIPFAARLPRTKKGGASAALFQALTRLEITYRFRQNTEVQQLLSFAPAEGSTLSTLGPERSAVALFLAEVLFKSLREESADADLYDFVAASIEFFTSHEFNPDFHLVFLLKLTKFLGFRPSGVYNESTPHFDLLTGTFTSKADTSHICAAPAQAEIIHKLMHADYVVPLGILNQGARRVLLELVVKYYTIHLEGMGTIKSLDVLHEVFA